MTKIILFDMDGTLTPARKLMGAAMVNKLNELLNYAKVGIVTGSGINYVKEQCKPILENSTKVDDIILMPCNGTMVYRHKEGNWQQEFGVSMEASLGRNNFRELIKTLLKLQHEFAYKEDDVPLIGHFISYRESLLNWCPLGRDATFSYREEFVKKDNERNIRKHLHTKLKENLESVGITGITAALGGNTSIDIYPTGWDKSFALKHFPEDEIWFVGDRCIGDGNDRSIYEALKSSNRSYQTTSPEQTIEIIDKIITVAQ